jgi:hypothetical protein
VRRYVLAVLASVTGYIVGAIAGYFLIEAFSGNTHDRAVEAAMTGAFVVGPISAAVAFVATLILAKAGAPATIERGRRR